MKKIILTVLIKGSGLSQEQKEYYLRALRGPRTHFSILLHMLSFTIKRKYIPDLYKTALIRMMEGTYGREI